MVSACENTAICWECPCLGLKEYRTGAHSTPSFAVVNTGTAIGSLKPGTGATSTVVTPARILTGPCSACASCAETTQGMESTSIWCTTVHGTVCARPAHRDGMRRNSMQAGKVRIIFWVPRVRPHPFRIHLEAAGAIRQQLTLEKRSWLQCDSLVVLSMVVLAVPVWRVRDRIGCQAQAGWTAYAPTG